MKRVENGRRILSTEVTKMQKGWKKLGLGFVAVGLCLVLTLGSVLPAKAESERVVKIGNLANLTGPVADLGVPVTSGFHDAIEYLNEEQSIPGVKVECMWEDVKYSITRMITAHKRFKVAGEVLEFSLLAVTATTTPDLYVKDEIPLVCGSAGTAEMMAIPGPRWMFMEIPTWTDIFITSLKGMKLLWPEKRPLRVAIMTYHDPVIAEVIKNAPWVCARVGDAEFVGSEVVPLASIDNSTEWLRLAALKPDVVWVGSYFANMVVNIKDYARLGIRKKGVEFVGSPNSIDEIIINISGKASEGNYVTKFTPVVAEADEYVGVRRALEAAKRYRGWELEDVTSNYVLGFFLGHIAFEAIRIAREQVGPDNITARVVRDALVSIKDFDTGIVPPFSISEEEPFYIHYFRTYQVQQGRTVPVGDWFEVEIVSDELYEWHI